MSVIGTSGAAGASKTSLLVASGVFLAATLTMLVAEAPAFNAVVCGLIAALLAVQIHSALLRRRQGGSWMPHAVRNVPLAVVGLIPAAVLFVWNLFTAQSWPQGVQWVLFYLLTMSFVVPLLQKQK